MKNKFLDKLSSIYSITFTLLIFLDNLKLVFSTGGPCALLEPHAKAKCIELASINRAFRDAREYFGLNHPFDFPEEKTHHHHHEIDKLGMTLIQTTKYLATEFDLNPDEVSNLLPQLDLELTDIWGYCPHPFRHRECKIAPYRSISGHCNNLNHPNWGSANGPFAYLLPPERPDGLDYPKDGDGAYLPPSRVVSSLIHRDHHVTHDHAVTVMLIAWGQIIDHDITLTAETKDPYTHKDPDCCHYIHQEKKDVHMHHNCFPIQIPHDDPFYSHWGRHCMNFARSIAGVRPYCRLGPRIALNTISSFLDASFVYGSNEHLSHDLRLGKYGMLRSLPFFHKYGLKDLLPLKFEEPDDGCIRPSRNIYCFLAGDHRVNEQLVLSVLHTIFMREHNRIAKRLSKINHHWNDEKTFQETRRIIIAITQHITFEEFLPMVLGKELMKEYGLTVKDEGHWNGYDPNFDPSATEEFITSAFRFGHSLLPHRIERWSLTHQFIDSTDLSKLIRQPFDLYKPGYIDTFLMGMVNQLAQAMDEGVTEQVTTMLFKKPYKHFGMDLASMNIQRGRDHAVAGYTSYRKPCGLPPIKTWDDLTGIMKNQTVYKYKQIYRSPHDIDLWSGGVSEIPNYGSLIGPTFGCIISRQFQALRHGDRFWYELPNLPSSFSEDQLHELKKVKLSRMLCDNSDALKSIQVYAMVYPNPSMNPRVPCKGLVLPRIDLEKWREFPQHSEEEHSHPNNKYAENYLTLHPPKFDPYFLNAKAAYPNASFETTQYSEKSPSYPQLIDHSVQHQSKNTYHLDQDIPHSYNTDVHADPTGHSDNTHDERPNYANEYNHYGFDGHGPGNVKGDQGDLLLETLEAPPVEPPLPPPPEEPVFIPRDTYYDNDNEGYKIPPPPNPRQNSEPVPRMRKQRVIPFPTSPFPGLGGIFSPNPGYLVKQKFSYGR